MVSFSRNLRRVYSPNPFSFLLFLIAADMMLTLPPGFVASASRPNASFPSGCMVEWLHGCMVAWLHGRYMDAGSLDGVIERVGRIEEYPLGIITSNV